MRLYKVEIENFRSIKELSVPLEPIDNSSSFTIFGVNETGKSNILKAISLLSPDTPFDYRDRGVGFDFWTFERIGTSECRS